MTSAAPTTVPEFFPRSSEPLASQRRTWMNQVSYHAVMRPDDTAFRYQGRDTSWQELHRRVRALAAALADQGIGFGDRVLVIFLNRTEYYETLLAINTLGAIAVPVNFRLTPHEVGYLVSDASAKGVVYEAIFEPLVTAVQSMSEGMTVAVRVDDAAEPTVAGALAFENLIGRELALSPIDVPEDSPALIMYTSGTTGRPKGAVLTHVNLQSQAMNNLLAPGVIDHEAVGALAVPAFHIAAVGVSATGILDGTTSVIFPLGNFDPNETLDALEREGITTVFMVPAQWQALVAVQQAKPRNLKLRFLWWGAAPASPALLRSMAETFPEALICAVFGQTEMSPVTCVLAGEDTHRKVGSVGKVIRNAAARIVDADGRDVPTGEIGEIVYRGPNLMAGYWNKPEETAAAFADGWFHSGDLVRQDEEGFIYVVDRKKDMIISGGENIYSTEVEHAIAEHPGVADVAVIGRSDQKWGEVPVAIVVPAESGTEVTIESIREFLADRLARYKHPAEVVVVAELPHNPAGKVTKPSLREQYASPQ